MDRPRPFGGAQKARRGRLRLCAGARRNFRLPRAAQLRPLLFLAQGRGRQGRGGDLEKRGRRNDNEARGTGRLTTYPGKSTYQSVIETLEPAGVGALMAQVEERKKKLAAEGLFD